MDNDKVAVELLGLAKELVAAKISKGDVVVVDVAKAKKNMDESEWGALKMMAPRSGNLMNVEFFNQRANAWHVTQQGGKGGFSIPEEALTPTGNQDPSRFLKDVKQLALNFETGSKVSTKLGSGHLSCQYVVSTSAPPLVTSDVTKIEKRIKDSVSKFLKGISKLFDGAKTNLNPYVQMAGKNGGIDFYSDFSIQVKPSKQSQEKLTILSNNL